MTNFDLLQSPYDIKIAWIHLADNYKSVGEDLRASEVLRELAYYSQNLPDIEVFRELYFKHLNDWETFEHKLKQA